MDITDDYLLAEDMDFMDPTSNNYVEIQQMIEKELARAEEFAEEEQTMPPGTEWHF
jgi:hypothetical protein